MSKHRRHSRDYANYDDLGNMNTGIGNLGSISSLLGNIDINQIASLLSSSGILNGLNNPNSNTEGEQKEGLQNILNNIDIGQILSQATNLNNMMNSNINNEVQEEEPRERHSKSRPQKERNSIQQQAHTQTQSQDSITVLLNAIKPLVTPERAEIINRIIELYIQGKI